MSTLIVTRGSDADFVMTWTDQNKDPIDLTAMTVVIFDADNRIKDRLSGSVTNGLAGEVTILLEGTSPIQTGSYKFRVQVNSADRSLATPIINLAVN